MMIGDWYRLIAMCDGMRCDYDAKKALLTLDSPLLSGEGDSKGRWKQ